MKKEKLPDFQRSIIFPGMKKKCTSLIPLLICTLRSRSWARIFFANLNFTTGLDYRLSRIQQLSWLDNLALYNNLVNEVIERTKLNLLLFSHYARSLLSRLICPKNRIRAAILCVILVWRLRQRRQQSTHEVATQQSCEGRLKAKKAWSGDNILT